MWVLAVVIVVLIICGSFYAYTAYIDKSDKELLEESREGHWLWYGREVGMLGLMPQGIYFNRRPLAFTGGESDTDK